jgi:uncharacterized protein (TIGR01244 family)
MRLQTLTLVVIAIGVSLWLTTDAAAQQATRETAPGITNLARLETTVACAGAIKPEEAIPGIKKMGFVSIINLREATEQGAELEKEEATAKAAGLKYFHVPFNGSYPTTQAADQFVAAITTPGAEPAFIHCAGGNRAATMWLIKRLVVDKWDADRATKEAISLGQTSVPLRQFALEYAQSRQR